jgi:parallel beta-helix repeat protein
MRLALSGVTVSPLAHLQRPRRVSSLALVFLIGCSGGISGPGGDDGGGIGGGDDDPEVPDNCAASPETSGDGVDNDCDGLVDERRVCLTGDAEFRTLGSAIAATPSGGALELCAGTYPGTFAIAGKELRLRGAGADLTLLDAGATGTTLTITGGREVILEDLTIRGGRTGGPGGGVVCVNSGLRLRDSAVIDNRADAGGGGVYAEGSTVRITRTRFERNEGTTRGGGALLLASTGDVTDSWFSANSADDGGAIALVEGEVDLGGSELRGNLARVHGGAIYQASDALVGNNLITANQSTWTGGGVYVLQHAPTFDGNTISDNTAIHEGGGMYLHESRAVLTGNTVTGNRADDDGGGLRLFSCDAMVERNHVATAAASRARTSPACSSTTS